MFETLAIHYHDQGSGLPPWEEDWTNGGDRPDGQEEYIEGNEMPEEGLPEGMEKMFIPDKEIPEEEKPIEVRASEAELLYANLLFKTDFEREFIEEMLEFEPDEESEMRIDELRRKRRELQEMSQQMPQTTVIPL